MKGRSDQNSISIKSIIIIVFMVLMLATVGVIGYIVFSNWLSSADRTTAKMAEDLNTETFYEIDTFIHVPEQVNNIHRGIIENGIVDLSDQTEREKFFVGVLNTQDNDIYSFSYGTEIGEYYGARRNENGIIEIMRNNAQTNGQSWYYSVKEDMKAGELVVQASQFDPRTREWYKAAKEAKKPVFSQIYKHFVMDDLTISAAYPIYNNNGELQGVLGTHIILSSIDGFLKEIVTDKDGFAVIVEKNSRELIANSFSMENFRTLDDSTIKRIKLDEAGNQSIIKAYENYINTGQMLFRTNDGSDSQYINLKEFHKDGLDWIVITGIPESLFMTDIIDSMKLTFILIILAMSLSMLIYFLLAKKLVKPMYNLIEVTEKLAYGDLSQRATIVRNDELGKISKAFNKMADTILVLINNLEATVKERTAELQTAKNELEASKDYLYLILDSTAEAIYGMDIRGVCTFCNASCLQLLGYKHQDELLEKNILLEVHHSCNDGTKILLDNCKIYDAIRYGEYCHSDDEVFWRADGTSFDVEYHSYPQYKEGEIVGAVVTFMDITERKRKDEQIKYLSCHDSLTDLYNRWYFEEAIKRLDTKKNLPISIIYGDINGLKLTNDIFGHAAGDALIRKSAEILKRVIREEDVVARVGGDEFILLLPNTETSDAEKIMLRIKNELSKEKIAAIKCYMSLGCDTKTSSAQDIKITRENAENGMYKEKTLTRKNINSDMIGAIITALHERSPWEKLHSITVSELCQNIGQALDLPKTDIKKLKEAGYLHDIGKIVLEDNILKNEGALTEEEKNQGQQHSVVGYRILNLFDDTLDLAEGVYSHHEKWDGSGYPKGLKGEEIPKLARIIAVAEAYDVMTNKYSKNAINKEDALEEMKKLSGVRLDPEITDFFINIMA